jgi:voltage-gated potassium channel Kch
MQTDRPNAYRFGARWLALMRAHRFDILLGALVLLLLSAPVVRVLAAVLHPQLALFTLSTAFGLVLLSAVFAVNQDRRSVMFALTLAVPGFFLHELDALFGGDAMLGASHLFSGTFLAYTILLILRFVFASRRVDYNTICAALCAYLLIGVFWANVYSFTAIVDPDSFRLGLAEEDASGAMRFGGAHSIYPIYFSFVTLTTLGYGDIVPTSAGARMLATMEAVMGQLYLAVLVARLVGLQIAQSMKHPPSPP